MTQTATGSPSPTVDRLRGRDGTLDGLGALAATTPSSNGSSGGSAVDRGRSSPRSAGPEPSAARR